jgi:hypothetical protein
MVLSIDYYAVCCGRANSCLFFIADLFPEFKQTCSNGRLYGHLFTAALFLH